MNSYPTPTGKPGSKMAPPYPTPTKECEGAECGAQSTGGLPLPPPGSPPSTHPSEGSASILVGFSSAIAAVIVAALAFTL